MHRLLLVLSTSFTLQAAVSFKGDIAPILAGQCAACHGPEKAKGGYRLDSFRALMRPGDSQKAPITAGNPAQSHLFALITSSDKDDRMPQKSEALSAGEIGVIKTWITEGAKFDGASEDESLAMMIPHRPGAEAPEKYAVPQPIFALAWSLDGQSIASAGFREALIWSPDGKLIRRIGRLPPRIHGLACLTNGLLAVAAGAPGKSGEVLLCNTESTEPPRVLVRLPDVAVSLAANRDRTLLAAGGSDNSIRIFEIPSGREIQVIQQHADWVTALAFSHDGTKLASASRDRTARLFDPVKGELLETYAEHDQALFAVAFSPDGSRVFSGGREKRVHAWQTTEGKKSGEFPALDGEILAICVAGKRLFASGGGISIEEFSVGDRKKIRSLKGHTDWVYALAADESSGRLASGCYNGEIRIWNMESAELLSKFVAAP